MGETLSYEAGGSVFNFVGQVQGTMGPGGNSHGVGGKWERRDIPKVIGLKAGIGFKITITPTK